MLLLPFAAVGVGLYLLHSAWATILLYHAGMLAYLGLSRPAELKRELFSGWRTRVGGTLSISCAASGLALVLLWPIIQLEDTTIGATLVRFGLHGPAWWIFVLYYSTFHPTLEEAFWRGSDLAQGATSRFADIAFGGYHALVLILFVRVEWALLTAVLLMITAWAWRSIARRYGGFAIPIVSHVLADSSIMVAAIYLANSPLGGLGV